MASITQLVAFGRRLMLPSDKRQAEDDGANDWPQIGLAGELREYKNGRKIVYVRILFSRLPGSTFTIMAVDKLTGLEVDRRENVRRYGPTVTELEKGLGLI